MSFPKRLFIFCVGMGLGGMLSLYILNKRGLERPEGPPQTVAEAEREAIPGIEAAYQERHEPMATTFVVGEFRVPGQETGSYRRVIVIEGRQPGQRLRIEEIQKANPHGQLQVESWRIMAADRIVMTLAPDSSTATMRAPLAEFGYRLLRKADAPNSYVVSLDNHDPESVDLAIERMTAIGTPVVAVTPDYLDNPSEQP